MNREEAMDLHPAGKQLRSLWTITPTAAVVVDPESLAIRRRGQFANGLLWWFGPGGDEW